MDMKKVDMIVLDGSVGEGGGQILRSALTLSMITGRPFRIENIRANRSKPGLMRQHLVAVNAAASICGADVAEAALGSTALTFVPGPIKAGDYTFAIGSAGSCTLVLQTVVPALLFADAASTVRISGGTHNPMAPPVEFLQRAYCRALGLMGAEVAIDIERAGFYPAGGGMLVARIAPCTGLRKIAMLERGVPVRTFAEALVADVTASVALRELEVVERKMSLGPEDLRVRQLPAGTGPGNVLLITLEYEHAVEVFSAIGEKGVPAHAVAGRAVEEARDYIASQAAVGEHLADQLMMPMALAGGGNFSASTVSNHSRTNAQVIATFLPISITFEQQERRSICRVEGLAK
jgi:RNA 3'-terminal phosphate cyclase (ATP)